MQRKMKLSVKGSECAKKNEIKHRLAKGGHDLQKFQHARQSLEKCTWFYDLNCRCSYICKIAISAIPTNVYHNSTISARSLNNGIIYASPCFMIPTVRACTRLTPHFMAAILQIFWVHYLTCTFQPILRPLYEMTKLKID